MSPTDWLGVLCVLFIVAAFVTVVGHSIWLFLAMIGRAVGGRAEQPATGTHCSSCGSPHGVVSGTCRQCGAAAVVGELQRQRADMQATRRQLNRWMDHGQISPEIYRTLSSLVQSDESSTARPLVPSPRALDATPFPGPPAPSVEPPPVVLEEVRPTTPAPVAEEIYTADIVEPIAPRRSVPAARSPFDEPEGAPRSAAPSVPRRALADMLQAFMEQKNIRWAEIVSGILIVVSAVGLVVSLRATLKDKIPYFPALSFMLVTAAIHAAGIYSLRRWNLKNTSRGVLIIATLLVPLSFLASIFLSGEGEDQRPATDPVFMAAVLVGVAAFGTMNYFAARALIPRGWWRLMTAVLGASLGQLIVNRFHPGDSTPVLAAILLSVPIGAFFVAVGSLLWLTIKRRHTGRRMAGQFFLELGIATFSLLAPISLYAAKSETVTAALGDLSPVSSLAASILLAAGLLVHRRMTSEVLSGYRMAGTALALLGAGAMLFMVAFAWPQLELLVAVGVLNFLVLTLLAFFAQLPALHVLAVGCLGLAFLSTFHWYRGYDGVTASNPSAQLVQATFTGVSGMALSVFTTLIAGMAGILSGKRRREDAIYYLVSAAGLAALCVGIAAYIGFFIPPRPEVDAATWIFLYFGAGALIAGWLVLRAEATLAGAVLLLVSCVHGLARNGWLQLELESAGLLPDRPWLAGFLVASVSCGVIALLAAFRFRTWRQTLPDWNSDSRCRMETDATFTPLAWWAVATAAAATPFAVAVRDGHFGEHAIYVAAASFAWLCMSLGKPGPLSFGMFQVLSTWAVVYTTASVCARQSWWNQDLMDARHIHAQIATLAVLCGAWSVVRIVVEPRPVFSRLWPDEWTVDRLVLAVLTGGVLVSALLGGLPGMRFELGFPGAPDPVADSAIEHRLWYAASSWIAWGAVLAGVGISLWEGFRRRREDPVPRRGTQFDLAPVALGGIVSLSAAIPILIASRYFDNQYAVASATRWLFAVYSALWCVPACIWGGRQQAETSAAAGGASAFRLVDTIQSTSLFFGAGVILFLTTLSVWCASLGYTPRGPAAGSYFSQMGLAASYAAPMAILVAVLFTYAMREGRATYALAASLIFQYGLTLACLLPVFTSGGKFDELVMARLLQWNAAGLGMFTCAWAAARRWIDPDRARQETPPSGVDLIPIQIGIASTAQLAIAGWIALRFFADPESPGTVVQLLGQWLSYAGVVATAAAFLWVARRATSSIATHVVCGLALILAHVIASSFDAADTAREWWGHHALSVGRILAAAAMTGWACALTYRRTSHREPATSEIVSRSIRASVIWATAAIGLAVLAAVRVSMTDPMRPWWPAGILVAGSILAGLLAIRGRNLGFAYFSTGIAALFATVFWLGLNAGHPLRDMFGLGTLHVIAICVSAALWLACEIWWQRRGETGLSQSGHSLVGLPVHHATGWGAILFGVPYLGLMALVLAFQSEPVSMNHAELIAMVSAFSLVLGLHMGAMWDRRSRHAIPGLYMGMLCLGAFVVERLTAGEMNRSVAMLAVVASQLAVSGWLWSWGSKLAVLGHRLGIAEPVEGLRRTDRWLPGVTMFLSACVAAMSFVIVVGSDSRDLRMTAGSMPFLIAFSLAGLAQRHRRQAFQLLALLAGNLAAVYLGWADIPPSWTSTTLLLRAIRLLMALSVLAFVFGVVLVRVFTADSGWRFAARRAAVMVAGSAIAVLLGVLAMEAATFEPGIGAPVDPIQIAAVSVVLIALLIALLSLAVLPGRDPLELSERGRMLYVYGAQVVGGLLFAHIYLTMPHLFSGRMRLYWPYILVAIAFAGVGVGELFQRLGLRVLAEPFQRSGAFMPLVPALGMWVAHSESNYSVVMFAIGVMYLLISFSQKSALAGAAAALAGNSSLWSLLNGTEDLTFANHPQFWLIPPALSVLVAAQINRRRLSDGQLAAVRYVAVSVIYLSSSIEMLTVGIGESLWPPMILIGLAVAGLFFGIAMQVRAYLYLGAIFIVVSSISMVAHASKSINHVWPWWAFLFAMGVLILVIFGSFEARRTQILAIIERMRQWEK